MLGYLSRIKIASWHIRKIIHQAKNKTCRVSLAPPHISLKWLSSSNKRTIQSSVINATMLQNENVNVEIYYWRCNLFVIKNMRNALFKYISTFLCILFYLDGLYLYISPCTLLKKVNLDQSITELLNTFRCNLEWLDQKMDWTIMSHWCSTGFRSGERWGRSVVSVPSPSRSCLILWQHEAGIVMHPEYLPSL